MACWFRRAMCAPWQTRCSADRGAAAAGTDGPWERAIAEERFDVREVDRVILGSMGLLAVDAGANAT